jgi:hypothetical protein
MGASRTLGEVRVVPAKCRPLHENNLAKAQIAE